MKREWSKVRDRRFKALDLIKEHGWLKTMQVAELLGITPTQAWYVLRKLEKLGYITNRKVGLDTYWALPDNNEPPDIFVSAAVGICNYFDHISPRGRNVALTSYWVYRYSRCTKNGICIDDPPLRLGQLARIRETWFFVIRELLPEAVVIPGEPFKLVVRRELLEEICH